MFCRYCGKPIAEDSVFCQFCGNKVGLEVFNNNKNPKLVKDRFYSAKLISTFKWANIASSMRKAAIFVWKVIRSIFVIIGMIIIYTIVGFFMAPFIALFNAEFPSLGMSDILVDIWKKKKTEEKIEESQPTD